MVTGKSTQETKPASLSKLTFPICKLSMDVIPVPKSKFNAPPKTDKPPLTEVVALLFEMETLPLLERVKRELYVPEVVAKVVGLEVEKYKLPPMLLKFQGASVIVPESVSCGVVVVAIVSIEIGEGVVVPMPTLSKSHVSPEFVNCVDEAYVANVEEEMSEYGVISFSQIAVVVD